MLIKNLLKGSALVAAICVAGAVYAQGTVTTVQPAATTTTITTGTTLQSTPQFNCTIVPGKAGAHLQRATVTVNQSGGSTLTPSSKVSVFLGTDTSKQITTVCGSSFHGGKAVAPAIITPAITDTSYNWTCTAQYVDENCSKRSVRELRNRM